MRPTKTHINQNSTLNEIISEIRAKVEEDPEQKIKQLDKSLFKAKRIKSFAANKKYLAYEQGDIITIFEQRDLKNPIWIINTQYHKKNLQKDNQLKPFEKNEEIMIESIVFSPTALYLGYLDGTIEEYKLPKSQEEEILLGKSYKMEKTVNDLYYHKEILYVATTGAIYSFPTSQKEFDYTNKFIGEFTSLVDIMANDRFLVGGNRSNFFAWNLKDVKNSEEEIKNFFNLGQSYEKFDLKEEQLLIIQSKSISFWNLNSHVVMKDPLPLKSWEFDTLISNAFFNSIENIVILFLASEILICDLSNKDFTDDTCLGKLELNYNVATSRRLIKNKIIVSDSNLNLNQFDLDLINEIKTKKEKKIENEILNKKIFVFQNYLYVGNKNGEILIFNNKNPQNLLQKTKIIDGPVEKILADENKLFVYDKKNKVILIFRITEGLIIEELPTKTINLKQDLNLNDFVINESLLICNHNADIYIWDIRLISEQHTQPQFVLKGHSTTIYRFKLYKNFLFSVGHDSMAYQWDLKKLEIEHTEPFKSYPVSSTSILTLDIFEDFLYLGDNDGNLTIFELNDNLGNDTEPLNSLNVLDGAISELKINNGMIYIKTEDGCLKIWNLNCLHRNNPKPLEEYQNLKSKQNRFYFKSETELLYLDKIEEICTFKRNLPKPIEDVSTFNKDFITNGFLKKILNIKLSSVENRKLWLDNFEYFKRFYKKEIQVYPLGFLIGLRYDEMVIKKYIPLLSETNSPFLKIMLDTCLDLSKEKKLTKKLSKKDNPISQILFSSISSDFKMNSETDILKSIGEIKIKENILQTIIFIIKKKSDPELGQYVEQILSTHHAQTSSFFSQLFSTCPKELSGEISELLFEKIGEVESELKNDRDIVSRIDTKNLLKENLTQNQIKTKFKSSPIFLTKYDIFSTRFCLDISNGSNNSISFFRMVQNMNSEQQTIFDELILFKWNRLKPWLIFQLLVFFSLTICYNNFLYISDKPFYLIGIIIILNSLNCFFEIKCAYSAENYFKSFTNQTDLIVMIGVYFFVFINYFTEQPVKILRILNASFCCLLNMRSITFFRVFDSLRYLIEMVLKIYKDIVSFLVIIVLFIQVNGMALMGIDDINAVEGEISFTEKVKIGLELALGNWDDIPKEWNEWNWLLFLVSSITFTIILLNLIIAIVSKTFDDYYENQMDVDRQAKLKLILELDYFCNWKNKNDCIDKIAFKKKGKFFQILKKQNLVNNIEELGKKIDEVKDQNFGKISLIIRN